MVKRESTSLNVDPEVWKKAKIEAITQGITLTELVESAIMELLTKKKEKR
ncbi:MAG: hypothetical protein ACRDFB_06105 [Rhabdochlamydiaceae bacterium]